MPPQLHEITGKFLRERHRFENESCDVVIADVHCDNDNTDTNARGQVSIKGPAEFGALTSGIRYRFFGRWTKYKNQPQFSFNSFVGLQPVDRESIIAYLAAHGTGHGLGKVRAARLWEIFGTDAVRIARTDPDLVAKELSGRGLRYSVEHAHGLASTLADDEHVESIKLDLTTLLGGRGFPKNIVDTIIQEWGNRGAEIVRRNPYRLLKFGGCGFKRCDAMYLDLGLNPTRLKRQAISAWYSLEQNTDGHTWYGWKTPDAYLRTNISSAGVRVDRALELATRAHILDEVATAGSAGPISQGGDVRWFADAGHAGNERDIAEGVLRAQSEIVSSENEYATLDRFDGYRVSTKGDVESCWTNGGKKSSEWKSLKADAIKCGYLRVTLRTGTMEYIRMQVSHLILEAFVSERPIDAVACHWDGNPKNNSFRNLRWDTRIANEEDKKRHGTHQTGSGNPAAKLTESQVSEIRKLYASGDISTYKLADMFGVSRPVVCKIVKHELWRHVS